MVSFLVVFCLCLLFFFKGRGWHYIAKGKTDVVCMYISKGTHKCRLICLNRLPSVRPEQARGQPSKNGGGHSETSPPIFLETFRGLVYVVSICRLRDRGWLQLRSSMYSFRVIL